MSEEWGLVRRKRAWVPEFVWWWVCNPIPFWNDTIAQTYPRVRVWVPLLPYLLTEPVKRVVR